MQAADGVVLYQARNTARGFRRYFQTLAALIAVRLKFNPDVYLLGFRGHEFYWPLRHLVGEKPIILDALMSPYASLSNERKHGPLGAIGATGWRLIEQSILNDATL